MAVNIKSSGRGVEGVARDIKRVKASRVLVGIPAAKAGRNGTPVNNAQLLFIHTNGSPLKHIPARPVLEPAVVENKSLIAKPMGEAAQAILNEQPGKAERSLNRAGIVASNAAKRYIRQGNKLAPNAPSTIRRKKSARPLVDTAQMVNAITYVVRTGK